ncbi:MAG: hypothetical protein NT033_09655 [Candidatus Omnitrophica bacterium]|nr:hypothetical protein [Candidatus Omnitrophota bacterium]
MLDQLIKQFHEEMINIYVRAKKECNYTPTYFLNMVNESGGLETAKLLLLKETVSSGFTKLYECGRLDLTVEALVLRNPWQQLFTQAEKEIAKKRLEKLGYFPVKWRTAVLNAIHRIAKHKGRKIFTRKELIQAEIENIKKATQTDGVTPDQTLSKILQDLRDEGVIYFYDDDGTYILLDTPINVESEELDEPTLTQALKRNKIIFGDIPAENIDALGRYRKGQALLRKLTLENYSHRCAFCDIIDDNFLVASHISRWADDPEGRGDLSNVICLCKFHDALFEAGYLSLSDELKVMKKNNIESETIKLNLDAAGAFREPNQFKPNQKYLIKHRSRTHTNNASGSNY